MERLINLFGELDEFVDYDGELNSRTVIWNFENTSLNVYTNDRYIYFIKYMASNDASNGVEIPSEQNDFTKDSQGNYDNLENIYQWEAICDSDADETEALYYLKIDDYDESHKSAFVEGYLQRQSIRKTEPDGIVYNRCGEPFVEYYIEETEN